MWKIEMWIGIVDKIYLTFIPYVRTNISKDATFITILIHGRFFGTVIKII